MSTDYTTPASSPHGPSLSRSVYGAPEATTPAATTQALIHVVDPKFGAHLPLKSGAPDDQAPTKRVDKDSHTVTIVQTTSTSQVTLLFSFNNFLHLSFSSTLLESSQTYDLTEMAFIWGSNKIE